MPLSAIFWTIMIIWLFLGGSGWYRAENRDGWGLGGFLIAWLAIAVLAWKVFGGIITSGN